MSAASIRVASLVGNFLSSYDQTATEGVENLSKLCSSTADSDIDIVHTFLGDAAAVDAFMSLFARPKMTLAPVLNVLGQLLRIARKPACALLMRLLLGTVPRQKLRDAVNRLSDHTLPTTVAGLRLMAVAIELNAKQTVAKIGRGVPLQSNAFVETPPMSQQAVRPARVELVLAFLRAKHPDVVTAAALQHGVLTRLSEDMCELMKRGEAQHLTLVQRAIDTIGTAFAGNADLTSAEKRTVLSSQRGVTRALTTLLGFKSIAESVAVVLRRIAEEVAEPSRDYAMLRDADDSRMPNFVLFALLRYLRPKHRALDAHLVVFVLHRCPDLCRPYMSRVARKLPEYDPSLSIPRASVAVCNTLTRLFLCPLPEYIASGSARLLEPTAKHSSFFDLTPETAADEVVPVWFREAAHRHIGANEGSAMMLVFLMQCMQGAIARAAKVKAAVERLAAAQCAAERASNAQSSSAGQESTMAAILTNVSGNGGIRNAADAATFLSQFEAIVQDRMPRREVLIPHIVATVKACTEAAPGAANGVATVVDTKEGFVMQRAALYLHSAASVFGWRFSFGVVLPSATHSWVPGQGAVALRSMNGTCVRSVCLLLISNLSRNLKLGKLMHVQLAGASTAGGNDVSGKGKEKKKGKGGKQAAKADEDDAAVAAPAGASEPATNPLAPPLLMELLYWAIVARDRAATDGVCDFAALRAIAHVVQWAVRSSIPGAHVGIEEAALWLKYATSDTATLLVHAVNYGAMLPPRHQQNLLSGADEEGAAGVLVVLATAFVAKQRSKESEGEQAGSPSVWVSHIRAHLLELEALIAKVTKRWPKREAAAEELLRNSEASKPAGGASGSSRTLDVGPTSESQALLLRHAKSSVGTAADHHTPVIVFFSRFVLPAPVEDAANDVGQLAMAAAVVPKAEAGVSQLIAAAAAANHKYASWFTALACARLGLIAAGGNAIRLDRTEAGTLLRLASKQLAEFSQVDELSGMGAAVLVFCVARLITIVALSPSDDVQRDITAAVTAVYTGTLGARDRVLFAALALLEHTPVGASSSAESTPEGASDAEDGANETDDTDSDDEHPAVKSSGILGPRPKKKGPRSEAEVRAAPDAVTGNNQRRKSPLGLRAFRDVRYLVGGASCLASHTPEVEALTAIVEGMTDRELVFSSLRTPLRIVTPVPEEASRAPLRLIFPDIADRQRKRTGRWFEQRASATGSVEPYDCDPVSSAVLDPRFIAPLFNAVAALRYRHVVPVNPTAVLRLAPFAVRMLSALDATLRQSALSCLAMMYRRLHPLPRLVVNTVRLLLQKQIDPEKQRPDSAPPRLLAVHTAHLALAFHPVSHFAHPLHERVTESLNLQDENAIPLDELLADFPASAVTGVPRADRPQELTTTPHLRHVLEQVARSCAAWQDYAFLQRRNTIGMLCLDAALLRHDATLRRQVLAALRSVCLCHAEDVAVHAAVQDHTVSWLLTTLEEISDASDASFAEEFACELLALLRALYPYFRTVNVHHRRTAAIVLGLLRFAHDQRVLSRTLLLEGLSIVEMAHRMGGSVAAVLAAADERAFVRELLSALAECGATLSLGRGSSINDALDQLRKVSRA